MARLYKLNRASTYPPKHVHFILICKKATIFSSKENGEQNDGFCCIGIWVDVFGPKCKWETFRWHIMQGCCDGFIAVPIVFGWFCPTDAHCCMLRRCTECSKLNKLSPVKYARLCVSVSKRLEKRWVLNLKELNRFLIFARSTFLYP
jgi:hypothetical protein